MRVNKHLRIFGGLLLIVSMLSLLAVNYSSVPEWATNVNYQIFGTFPESNLRADEKINFIPANADFHGDTIEILVELTAPTGMATFQQMKMMPTLQTYGTVKNRFSSLVNVVVMEVDESQVNSIAQNKQVKSIYTNEPVFKLTSSQPTIRFLRPGECTPAQIDKMWTQNYSGKKVAVAVCDSGINHPAVNDRVVFTWSFDGNVNRPPDGNHGTACAGVIASNDISHPGIAPDVVLLDIHAFHWQGGAVTSSGEDILGGWEAIYQWKIAHPDYIVIASNSWGVPQAGNLYDEATKQLKQQGIICVCAAGNEDSTIGRNQNILSPGSSKYVLCVGAVDDSMMPASFTSVGPAWNGELKPDVCAFGVTIDTTNVGGGWMEFSGTSAATPYVAGCIALLAEAHPDWSVEQFYSAVKSTTMDLGRSGWDPYYGYGFIQVYNAHMNIETEFLPDNSAINYGFMMLAIVGVGFLLAPRQARLHA